MKNKIIRVSKITLPQLRSLQDAGYIVCMAGHPDSIPQKYVKYDPGPMPRIDVSNRKLRIATNIANFCRKREGKAKI